MTADPVTTGPLTTGPLTTGPARSGPASAPRCAVVCMTPRGGHVEHAYNLARAVADRSGEGVLLVSRRGAGEYLAPARRPGDGVLVEEVDEGGTVPGRLPRVLRVGLRTVREARAVGRRVRRPGLRTVVLEEPHMVTAAPWVLPGRRLVSVVHNAREHDEDRAGPTATVRALLRRAVVAASATVLVHGEVQARALGPAAAGKVRVVELPGPGAFEVGLAAAGPAPRAAGPAGEAGDPGDALLCLGEVRENKNYEDAVRAAAATGCPLLVAGAAVEPAYAQRLRALAAELGAPVRWETEFLPPARFEELVRGARAVVLPYGSFAAQSGVLERALAVGTPVLAADLASLREQAGGRAGVRFYGSGDVGALADLVRTTAPRRRPEGADGPGAAGAAVVADERWEAVAAAVVVPR